MQRYYLLFIWPYGIMVVYPKRWHGRGLCGRLMYGDIRGRLLAIRIVPAPLTL